jgi:hypothetical protein
MRKSKQSAAEVWRMEIIFPDDGGRGEWRIAPRISAVAIIGEMLTIAAGAIPICATNALPR